MRSSCYTVIKKESFILNIETFILVTIWKNPFVFQGSFTITDQQSGLKNILIFRCECTLQDKMDIQKDFSPSDYRFSHLYSAQILIPLEKMDNELNQAVYLLKYALKTTLEQLILHSTQYFTYMDEIASSSLSEKIKNYLDIGTSKDIDNNIGFAVSIDFNPTDRLGKSAALTLLNINHFVNLFENNSLH